MSKYSPLWQFLKNEGNETYQLSFEEIKEKDIEELDYEKAHDLADVENTEYCISAY